MVVVDLQQAAETDFEARVRRRAERFGAVKADPPSKVSEKLSKGDTHPPYREHHKPARQEDLKLEPPPGNLHVPTQWPPYQNGHAQTAGFAPSQASTRPPTSQPHPHPQLPLHYPWAHAWPSPVVYLPGPPPLQPSPYAIPPTAPPHYHHPPPAHYIPGTVPHFTPHPHLSQPASSPYAPSASAPSTLGYGPSVPGQSPRMLRKLSEDSEFEGWTTSSSESDIQEEAGGSKLKKKRRKRKKKRDKLKKKPLPPPEITLQKMPLRGGGVLGPLAVHQSFAGWKLVLDDNHRRSFVSHRKQAFTRETLQQWWHLLTNRIHWLRPSKEDFVLPRTTAWLTRNGCSCQYEYFGLRVPPAPMEDWLIELTDKVCRTCGLKDRPDACNVNLYSSGEESVSWHADDEPLFDAKYRDALIISLSLGATRSFELRPKDDPFQNTVLQLEDGDLCTMEGLCQKHYRHRIGAEPDVKGARINLTWRWVLKHEAGCVHCRE